MAQGIVESSKGVDQSGQQPQGISRSKLVQRLLAASSNLPAFINDLLTTQAVVVAGTEAAGFIIEPGQDGKGFELKTIAHIRPDNSDADTRTAAISAFQGIVRPCVEQGKDGAIQVSPETETVDPQFCLVTLLRSDGNVVAVSAVITRCRDQERATQRLMSMELVAGYFELFTLKRTSEQARTIAQSHQHVLQLASTVATADGFDSGAMNLCNELATRTGAVRVSLGWVKGSYEKGTRIKLKALSHTEQFDKKQELAVQLVKTMEECADQGDGLGEIVQYDPAGSSSQNVTREAQALSRMSGGNTILSLPLRRKEDCCGVITLEFAPATKIGAQAATGLAVAVELLAPQLYDRYQNDRWLITKAGISARETLKMLTGPKHMLAKTLIVLAIAGILFITFYKPMYHVAAPFQFDAIDRQAFSVPFESAVLEKVNVKPGQEVKKGDVLLKFETYELTQQMTRAMYEKQAAQSQATAFRADPTKTADYLKSLQDAKAAEATEKYYQSQIEKATITAPFDGVILIGDLKEKRGSVFKQGEPLMEMAATGNDLRVEIAVAERDIQDVQLGAKGTLATSSLPNDKYDFVVERIVPLAEGKEGNNFFKVYGTLSGEKRPEWRPGMAGEAKVAVEERSLAWIWTHRFTDWVQVKWWQLW
jgi:multidrug resistance efflux pump